MKLLRYVLAILLSLEYIVSTSINVCVSSSTYTDKAFTNLLDAVDTSLLNCPSADGIGKAVRLTFHDCVSGCNGCVDMLNPDNNGLDRPIMLAARVYARFMNTKFFGKYKLSRADMYALFGLRAIYISSNSTGLTQPTCEFKIGRKDCTGAQDNKEIFTTALGNWQTISEFFRKEFKFSTQEIVALMGAHALGRTWPESSNHTGPWVAHNNKVFSNSYYQNMLDREGKLLYAPDESNFGKQQWSALGDVRRNNWKNVRVMLNSDMCLLKLFNVDEKGVPDCTYKTCKTNSESAEWVNVYADSEPKFKKDFSEVYQKMLQHGYEGTNTLYDIIPDSAVHEYIPTDNSSEIVKMILKSFDNDPDEVQFKKFHLIFKKGYEVDSEEGVRRYKTFTENLKNIKEQNKILGEVKYGINSYTDMTFGEYFKEKFRVDPVHLHEFDDMEFDRFSHLLLDN